MKLHSLFFGLSIALGAGVATAADTRVVKLHNVDAAIVAALEKDKMPATKLVREHFKGFTVAKIEAYAKSKKLDADSFVRVVRQTELLQVAPLQVGHAWIMVHRCNVQGLAQLESSHAGELQKCIDTTPGRDGIVKLVPTVEQVQAWIDEAKRGEVGDVRAAERAVPIARIEGADEKVLKAFDKKGWKNNIDVVKNLSVSGERDAFSKAHKLENAAVDRALGLADFLRVTAVNGAMAQLLWDAGMQNVGELGGQRAEDLLPKLVETNQRTRRVTVELTLEGVARIVGDAKSLGQHR